MTTQKQRHHARLTLDLDTARQPSGRSTPVPISLPNGITIRTVTFWYPANLLGITDWRAPLANLFDDDLRPERG
jgi:hypothetical protein